VVLVWWALRPGPGRVLYRGGPILTLDAEGRLAEALVTEGDRIVAVGSERELATWQDGARVVDLAGRALLPGFIDAHGHFPGAGIFAVVADLNAPPIGDVATLDALVARLRAQAETLDEEAWVVGLGYDDTLLAEGRHPTRRDLDRVSKTQPVGILHVSGHVAAANSAALARLGMGPETPDPPGGVIRREPDGAPDGVLEESAAERLSQAILQPSPLDSWRIAQRANEVYLAAGVTTAQNGYADALQARGLAWLARLGLLPLRVVVWPSETLMDQLLAGELSFPESEHFRLGAVKLIADGSIQAYTGYLSEPYFVPPGDDPDYRGYPRIARDELLEQVARYHAAGVQVAVHGNGDASIDDILDAFEAAAAAHPRSDARHVVIHAQMARDDQLDRMRDLGVIPSFFSLHTWYWGDRHRERFMGPARAARMSPAQGAAERGIRFTIHCDTPVVPMEPLRLVWSAVNRRSAGGVVLGPEQRISVERALRAVTIDAARQHFEEADKGSLEPGKLADLVILDRNPLEYPESIDRIRVLETVVGGRPVWRADGV
jgi:hypothetical protein